MSNQIDVDLEKLIGQLYVQLQGQAQFIMELQAQIAAQSALNEGASVSPMTPQMEGIAKEAKAIIQGANDG